MKLEKEYIYYQSKKDKLMKEHLGKFALVKGNKIIGCFSSENKAYEDGLKRFGNQAFLIEKIAREDKVTQSPALVLGIL